MKNTILFLFAFVFFASCSGCKDKEEPTGIDFDVTFKATYDGNQLEKNKDYLFGTIPLYFIRCRLYLSDITLLKADGTEKQLAEVEYLDFTADNGASNLTVTPKITYKNVPEGEYTGIRLGYGVKPSLNAKDPSDFPTGHPLNIETDYWASWGSYIFMVLDGKADPDGDGVKNLSLAYHCGSDAVYKVFTINHNIVVAQGQGGITIEFDMLKFLTNEDGSLYDIAAHPATSDIAGNIVVSSVLMANFGRATTVKP